MTTSALPLGKSSSPKTIRNPRRLLILSPTSHSTSIIPPLLHSLTGVPVATPPTSTSTSAPTPATQTDTDTDTSTAQAEPPTTSSFAGYTTHPPLRIENRYYKAEVPIWVDEVPLDSPPSSSATPSNTYQKPEAKAEDKAKTTEDDDDDDPAQSLTPAQWKTAFSSAEAQVVRDAVGAVVICVRNFEMDSTLSAGGGDVDDITERDDVRALKDFVRAILSVRELIEEERGGLGEIPGVVVLVGKKGGRVVRDAGGSGGGIGEDGDEDGILGGSDEEEPFSVAWWEDQLYEMGMMGLEVVSWDPREEEGDARNQFGEYQGMRRIREVLETHEWTDIPDETTAETGNMDEDDLERHLLGLDEENGFDLEVNELEREMVGLRFAIERGGEEHVDDSDVLGEGDDELDVDAVEALLSRMKAIKDMSDELPEEERKRFAAKAVRDIMKDV